MSWTFGTSISAPVETNPGVSFGVAVAVGDDYIAIASRGTSPSLHTHYITPGSQTLTSTGQVQGPSDSSSVTFGSDISINGDFVAVGDSQGGAQGQGQVSIYKLPQKSSDNTTFIQTISGSSPGALFGQSVALGESFLVVGSPGTGTGGNTGSVNVYKLISNKTKFDTFPEVIQGVGNNQFGYSVSVTEDNTNFMVGNFGTAIYVYNYGSSLSPGVTDISGQQPINVSINGDLAVVGLPDSVSGTGETQMYRLDQWTDSFSEFIPDGADSNNLPLPQGAVPGTSVGFSNSYSGDYIVTGGPGDSSEAGLVQIYNITSEAASGVKLPSKVSIINNPTPADGDQLGFSVSISNDYMVAGAPNGGTDGKGYVNFYAYKN